LFLDVRVRIAPRARLAFSIIRGSINQAGLTVNDSDTLRNKVVVVTGASRGIGREISISFASQGCRVVLAARSSDQLEIVAKAVQAAGGTAAAITCDVSDRTSARALISGATQAFGSVIFWSTMPVPITSVVSLSLTTTNGRMYFEPIRLALTTARRPPYDR